jgi:hypothetical protein
MPYLSPTTIATLVLIGLGCLTIYCGYRARGLSTMPSEMKAKVFMCGLLAGLAMIGFGIFTYARDVMSPLTPEKIVQRERSRVTLPMDIDELTRWESIEAGPQRVRYMYTVRKMPRDREALTNALRQQITQSVCADQVYRDAVKQRIAFEFVYKFPDETYPAITLSPAECEG